MEKNINKRPRLKIIIMTLSALLIITSVIITVLLLQNNKKPLELRVNDTSNNVIVIDEANSSIEITFMNKNYIEVDKAFSTNKGDILLKKNHITSDNIIYFNDLNISNDEYKIIINYKSDSRVYQVNLNFSKVVSIKTEKDISIGYAFKDELGLLTYEKLENETENKGSKYFLDKELLNEVDFTKQIDKVVYIKYNTEYIVIRINANGGATSDESILIIKGEKIGNLPVIISSPTDFTFDNWYLNDETLINKDTVVNNDIEIIASWKTDLFTYTKEFGDMVINKNTVLTFTKDLLIPNYLHKGQVVKRVGDFSNLTMNTNKIIIDEGFITLNENSFRSVDADEVVMPNTLEIIDKSTFEGSFIRNMNLRKSEIFINTDAFKGSSIYNLEIGVNTIMAEYAFNEAEVFFSNVDGVTKIYNKAFFRAYIEFSITDFEYPFKSLDEIGISAFEEATLPMVLFNARIIKENAFKNFSGGIFLENRIEVLEEGVFYMDDLGNSSVGFLEWDEEGDYWPKAQNTGVLKEIGKDAFRNMTIFELKFSEKIEFIGESAFEGTLLVQELAFVETINALTIQDKAFANMSFEELNGETSRTITIPSNIKHLGTDIFINSEINT